MAVLVGRANKPRWAKEGEGSETARRLGREQRETTCPDWRPFWVVRMPAYGSFRLDQNVRPSIKYLIISHRRVPSDWTNLLDKTKSKHQRRVDRSVVDLGYSTGYWSLNGKWPFTVFFMEEIDLFLSRLHRSVVRPTKPPCNAGYQNARWKGFGKKRERNKIKTMSKIEPQHMQSILFQKVGVFGTFLRRDALVVPVSGGLIIIQCKILLFTFYAIHGLAPKYLCDLPTFKLSLYKLRSSGSILLSMPAVRSKTTLGDTAFMVAAPRLWNSLPKELRAITIVNSFKAHIRTYIFRTVYWWSILYSVLACMHIYSFYYFFFECIIFCLFLLK